MKFIENFFARKAPKFSEAAGPKGQAYIKAATNGATATKKQIVEQFDNGSMKRQDLTTFSKEAQEYMNVSHK